MNRVLLFPSTCAAVVFCAALLFVAPQARAEEVDIPDANLDAALRAALGIPSDPLQDTDLASLTSLFASGVGIVDLTGLEYCTSLSSLTLSENQIEDLTPLAGLTSLFLLALGNNQIFDVSPLAGLSNLSILSLGANRIVDVTPLSDLSELDSLTLTENPICDLEPFVTGAVLGPGKFLEIAVNPLTTTACATQIPALEARGIAVDSGISCSSGGVAECGVAIPDRNLEAALRSALAIPTDPLLDSDLASLTLLNASTLDIADLTGLEFCTGLTSLDLASNEIVDLTPLAGLTALTSVDLSSNQIADLTPLAGLANLESLELDNNLICDLAPLVDNTGLATGDSVVLLGNPLIASACATQIPALTGRGVTVDSGVACDSGGFANCWIDIPDPNLEAALRTTLGIPTAPLQDTDLALVTILSASDRGIVDLTGLEYCTNLERLFLFANRIVDLTPLAGLSSLTNLELLQNRVTDVTPLAGLTSLTSLGLKDNKITDVSPLAGLTGLTSLSLGDNKITDVSPLEGLTNLSFLSLAENQICDLTPLVDNAGLATDDFVFVGVNPLLAVACGTQIPALSGRGVTVDSGTACDSGGETYCLVEPVNIPDPNLEAALRALLGIPSAPLTYGNLASVTNFFNGSDQGIVDLTGLEYCTNLTALTLNRNQITDLTPISGLTGLTRLFLGNNQITDLGPLSGLSNLTDLRLEFNQITDLTPLSGLASLTDVNLYNNQIVDLTPLSGLTTLDELDLSNNQIIDAAPLSGLTSITYISLDGNQVTDIAPLSGLTALTLLELRNNQITNVAPLATLSSLEELVLTGNPVADVTPLTGLTSLNYLLLDGTLVCDLTPLVDNAAFASGSYVSVEGNSLSADTCTNQIPTLTGRGVTVESGTACDGGGIAECPSSGEGEGEGVTEGEPTTYDFGDAPEPPYATLLASNGARHALDGVTFLGFGVTAEADGQPSANADADASDDGCVINFTSVGAGEPLDFSWYQSVTAYVNIWIDYNGDGDFNDTGERVLDGDGFAYPGGSWWNYTALVPVDAPIGSNPSGILRLRLSTVPGAGPDGLAPGFGEVEDYLVAFKPASEGEGEGGAEGEGEGVTEGEGEGEGVVEGEGEGVTEGEGEGIAEGEGEGVNEGEGEGVTEGEGEGQLLEPFEQLLYTFASADVDANSRVTLAEILVQLPQFTQQDFDAADANGDGSLSVAELLELSSAQVVLSADTSGDYVVSLSELLRVVQLYNAGGYACAVNPGASEDGFTPEEAPGLPACVLHGLDRDGDNQISLSELLRGIQVFSFAGYSYCDGQSEDSFCDRP